MNNHHLPGAPDAAGGIWPFDKKPGIEGDAPIRFGVELHHPSIHSFGIELLIDRAIKPIGEVDPPPITADLNHLRSAVQGGRAGFRVGRA